MRFSIFTSKLSATILAAQGYSPVLAEGPAAEAQTATPTQIYLDFHEKMLAAKSIDEISPWFTKSRADQIKADKENMPAEQLKAMFGFMQELAPRKVRVIAEKIIAENCMLAVEAPDYKDPLLGTNAKVETKGTIRLIRQEGVWKIEKEQWNSGDASSSPAPQSSSGATSN